jgi:prophage regulatory protein
VLPSLLQRDLLSHRFGNREEAAMKAISSTATAPTRNEPRSSPEAVSLLHQPIRRAELRRLVPLSDTTIYTLERRGDFPRRFLLTARCVAWDLAEVEAWIAARRASQAASVTRAPWPDVRRRHFRPVAAVNRKTTG